MTVVKEKITLSEKKVSLDEFKKLADRKVVVFWNHRLAGLLEWLREESN